MERLHQNFQFLQSQLSDKLIATYVWLDGNEPQQLRSKKKVLSGGKSTKLFSAYRESKFDTMTEHLPPWSFDGSSTSQAEGNFSDCDLIPVRTYRDPFLRHGILVLCEVEVPEQGAHGSNTRHKLDYDDEYWWGFEQEFTLDDPETNRPLGFPKNGYPEPQGPYYCAEGYQNVAGREIVKHHLLACLYAGIDTSGTNAEVMLGQWEYQVFGKGVRACDDLIISRHILYRLTEMYQVNVSFQPKPVKGDWNGSGCHINFSNHAMREQGGEMMFEAVCKTFATYHLEHMDVYGLENKTRLTGSHETAHFDEFSYGVSDRGASIRIPRETVRSGWTGYMEDRRPASNVDPYLATNRMVTSIKEAMDSLE